MPKISISSTLKSWIDRKVWQKLFTANTILVYHRVADTIHDPHQLAVSPENFRHQLLYLKKNFEIVPLSQMAANLAQRSLQLKQLAITFDDGYADNLYQALPILTELSIPATVFVVTGKLDSPEPFYWDKQTTTDPGRALTTAELLTLAHSPLIEIGAHTTNHPKLSKIAPADQQAEIIASKNSLEKVLGQKINGFAYPFGDQRAFTATTIEKVRDAGFDFACANNQKRVYNQAPLFAIPRLLVRNYDEQTLAKLLL